MQLIHSILSQRYQKINNIMDKTTGSEASQSINISFYYRGFSVQITKRDPKVDIEPILLDAKAMIEKSIGLGYLPSWNPETNKAALGVVVTPVVVPTVNQADRWLEQPVDKKMCPLHPTAELKARDGQYGVFWSHWLGKDPSTQKSLYCKGK